MNRCNHISYILFFLMVVLSFFSCKTKKAPFVFQQPLVKKLEEKIVLVQVCDKFQMSYNGLPCIAYFSDGTSAPYTTEIDGKIAVRIPVGGDDIEISRIVFDFSAYKPRSGQLLASRDFKLATRIPSSSEAKTTIVEGIFSSEVKNLFVLVR